MKNYKFLVPVLLVTMFLGSFYMLYDQKATEFKAYQATLDAARSCRKMDVQVDAEKYYQQAFQQNPSMELALEIGDYYMEIRNMRKTIDWAETLVEEYPKDVQAYEFLLQRYEEQQDYAACFQLMDVARKRQLHSQLLDDAYHRMEYYFYYNGKYEDVGRYSGGLCPVSIEGRWGYVNQSGQQVVGIRYLEAGPFYQGMAPVVDQEGRAYYIDPKGNKKFVIQDVEDIQRLGTLEQGILSIQAQEQWQFYRTADQTLFGGYEAVSSMHNGVAAVQSQGLWHLIDGKGTDLTGKAYEAVAMDENRTVFSNERLFVSHGNGYQMIDASGMPMGNGRYEDVRIFQDGSYAAVKVNGKWGFADKDGSIQLEPQYEDAHSFSCGIAAVKQDGLWGFIDRNGKMLIEPQFENVGDFNSKGCVFVFHEGLWKLLRLYKTNH